MRTIRASRCLCFGLRAVALAADRLQVLQAIRAAFRLRHNVVNLFCLADATSGAARLAEVQVTSHHRVALAAPRSAASSFAVVLRGRLSDVHGRKLGHRPVAIRKPWHQPRLCDWSRSLGICSPSRLRAGSSCSSAPSAASAVNRASSLPLISSSDSWLPGATSIPRGRTTTARPGNASASRDRSSANCAGVGSVASARN